MGKGASEARRLPAAAAGAAPLPSTTYLLVHPEPFPSNDTGVILPSGVEAADVDPRMIGAGLDAAYGAEIARRSSECGRRIVVLDAIGREALEATDDAHLTSGLPAKGWEILDAEPHAIGQVVRRAFRGYTGTVLVGGYARTDCVARAIAALRRLGIEVSLHDEGTLPLSFSALDRYADLLIP